MLKYAVTLHPWDPANDFKRSEELRSFVGEINVIEGDTGGLVGSRRILIKMFPDAHIVDYEGDHCMVGRLELYTATFDVGLWPTLKVTGLLKELRWAEEVSNVEKAEGGTTYGDYLPAPDPSWTPQLVYVTIRPVEGEER